MFHRSIISKGVLNQKFTSRSKLCVLPVTKFAIFYTDHKIFIKPVLLIINNNETVTVWCQSEMFSVAAVTVTCRAALVTGKKWYMTCHTPDGTR
jgi:hypothetical protein